MHLLITGKAGTGKTTQAVKTALNTDKKIIIVRNVIETGKGIGFLPGDVDEKIRPFFDIYKPIFDELVGDKTFNSMVSRKRLEFYPTAFLRGVTFSDSEVILDEFQNLLFHEAATVVTRVGKNSRLMVVGDCDQSDLPVKYHEEPRRFQRLYSQLPGVKRIHLTQNFRNGIVADFLDAVEADNAIAKARLEGKLDTGGVERYLGESLRAG